MAVAVLVAVLHAKADDVGRANRKQLSEGARALFTAIDSKVVSLASTIADDAEVHEALARGDDGADVDTFLLLDDAERAQCAYQHRELAAVCAWLERVCAACSSAEAFAQRILLPDALEPGFDATTIACETFDFRAGPRAASAALTELLGAYLQDAGL
jgi:hypothetical protein